MKAAGAPEAFLRGTRGSGARPKALDLGPEQVANNKTRRRATEV